MLIELLIVGVIMSYLYSAGLIDFGSPYAIWVTLALTAVCVVVGWVLTHLVAGNLINGLLGMDTWTPRKLRAGLTTKSALAGRGEPMELAALQQLVKEAPKDAELSRRLSEEYLSRGLVEQFVAERLRIIEVAALSREEVCMILNRLADAELMRDEKEKANDHLRRLIAKYPNSVEAANAKRRIAVIGGEEAGHEVNR